MLPLVLAAALSQPTLAASVDPDLKWRTIETEHFRIHFHQGCEQVADELSTVAEDVYERQTREMGWLPRARTEVTLLDRTDSANGFASVIPYNAITIYVTAPNEDSNLNFYEDWTTAIFTHEFTHILHLDTNHAIVAAARAIVGRVATTNGVSPGWMIEGYATFQETRQTEAGRGRAPLAEMLIRTASIGDAWPPLGNLDGFQVDVPSGNLRYVFGQDFIQWIADHRGEDVWTRWIHTYGSRVPFILPTRKVFGASLQRLYREWTADRALGYGEVVARIRAEGETQPRILSADPRASCQSPSFSPDGLKLVWACSDNREGNAIWIADGDGYAPRILLDRHGAKTFTWRRDSAAFVYAGTHTVNQFNTWSDIYLKTLGPGRAIALTAGARARDPEFSPDGARLLMVTNRAQDNQLEELRVDQIRRSLTDNHDHTQLSTPRFSPDGRSIALSVWQDGRRDLWLYHPDGTPARRLTADTAIDVDPAWSADGRWLYFSSDRTGIPNIYAIDVATEHLWQVTNVTTGAIRPSVRPDGRLLAWQQWSVDGWDIAAMDLDPARFVDRGTLPVSLRAPVALADLAGPPAPAPGPVAAWEDGDAVRRMWAADAEPATAAQQSERTDSFENVDAGDVFGAERDYPFRITPTRYNPLRTLWPRYVLPGVALTPFAPQGPLAPFTCAPGVFCRGIQASLATSGADTLRQYGWSAYGLYTSDANAFGAGGSVTFNRYRPVYTLQAATVPTSPSQLYTLDPASDPADPTYLELGQRYYERRSTAAATVTFPYHQRSSVFARYAFSSRTPLYALPDDAARELLPLRGTEGSISAGYRYAWAQNTPYAVGPEDGEIYSLVGSLYTPWLGSTVLDPDDEPVPLTQVRLTGEAREYLNNPWLSNQVLALRVAGGVTFGETQYLGNYQLGGNYGDNAYFVTPEEYRMLRGYPFGSDFGDMYWLSSAEYRVPLWRIDRGYGTFPAFFRNLSGAVFTDAGNAFDGNFLGRNPPGLADVFGDPLVGVGAEIALRGVIGWGVGINLRAGYAIGLTEGGFDPRADPLRPIYFQFGGVF